ncbi:hypothetical protein HDU85_006791 [Gaertneriomyces sp. JEL0708]|nr:hypothetical protein HDU85_006791 [Gaertneriomyces sp. JEL0708]
MGKHGSLDAEHRVNELEHGMKREMKTRHISMIAVGGTIGTGLFVGSGASIAEAGPVGALIAYAFIGFAVFCIMTALGEMATLIPVSGSFNHYASRFVDPAVGFALGWNYWLSWSITIAAELSAAGLIINYWNEVLPTYVWSLILLACIVGFNLIGGKGYGEVEFWLSMIKIITVLIFIVVAIIVAAGGIGGVSYGFSNWRNPGAFNDVDPVKGGTGHAVPNILGTMLYVGFSYMGTELVGIAAGESANPAKAVPIAIRNVFFRILLFYIISLFLIGLIIPFNDSNLLDASDENIAIAPFTLVFKRAGVAVAADIMNAILITVIVSASNSALYCGSRTLMAMAREGKAPKFFGKVNKWGVPVYALLATAAFGLIAAASAVYAPDTVFSWVMAVAASTGFISWAGIGFTHYRFRKAFYAQGRDLKDLPYKAWAFPFSSLWGAGICTLVVIFCGYSAFLSGPDDDPETPDVDESIVTGATRASKFFQNYISVIMMFAFWAGYKLVMKSKMVPLTECDFETGARWKRHMPIDGSESNSSLSSKVKRSFAKVKKTLVKS